MRSTGLATLGDILSTKTTRTSFLITSYSTVLEFAEQMEAAIGFLDGASGGLEAAWDELASEAYAIQEAERCSA